MSDNEITCPNCGGTNCFEKRGQQRTFHFLDADLKADSWTTGEIDLDTFVLRAGVPETGEIIYCLNCDAEWTEAELVRARAIRLGVEA